MKFTQHEQQKKKKMNFNLCSKYDRCYKQLFNTGAWNFEFKKIGLILINSEC